MRTVYLDYNATTPLDPMVREAMFPHLGEVWGNPSSVHHIGRRARALLDEARDRLARLWGSQPSEVIFTSGGTEASNLALCGAARWRRERGRHLVTSAIEHDAVRLCLDYLERREGFSVTRVPVDAEGRVAAAAVADALRPDTILVSVMAANNETGALQPVAEIGSLCRERGVLFHTDAVQWFGKEPFTRIDQFHADLVSCCAHKFHGPRGAGALFVRSPLHPDPILFGGGHENERRAGTENLAAIAGLVEAAERFVREPVFCRATLGPLAERLMGLVDSLGDRGVVLRTPRDPLRRLANTVAFTVRGADSMTLLAGLDLEGICASSGSACSAGSLTPSHVMKAMGVGPEEAGGLVRFSLGRENGVADVEVVESILPQVIARALG